MNRPHRFLTITALAVAMATPFAMAEKKKVVFLADGGKNAKTHAHVSGNALLAKALEESGLGIETAQNRGWPADPKFFEGADCLVIFCNGAGGHLIMKHLDEFEKFIDDGMGLVCLHFAVEVPKGRAGDLMLKGIGGYFEMGWSVNPHWKAAIKSLPKHPITQGITPYEQQDEWYYHMRFAPEMKGVTPILSAHPPKSHLNRGDGGRSNNPTVRKAIEAGEIQHIAWAYDRPGGKGRGFGTTGGHHHNTWDDDNWRTLVLNGIVWATGMEVPEKGVPSKPNPVKEAKKK